MTYVYIKPEVKKINTAALTTAKNVLVDYINIAI